VDGEGFEDIETAGREAWLERLRQELKAKAYRPQPLLRVWIPKASGGERPLGIPRVRDRVVQTAVLLVIGPVFEPDLFPWQYGFRTGLDAKMAVRRIHFGISERGKREVVDADLSDYLDLCSYYPPADSGSSKRSGMVSGSFIFSPLRLPWETWMASTIGTYPAGASPAKRARSVSVTMMRQGGAPGVSCVPAMSSSFRCRCRVDGATASISAASRMVSGSPMTGAGGGNEARHAPMGSQAADAIDGEWQASDGGAPLAIEDAGDDGVGIMHGQATVPA
jgi:hypothetical protein